MATFEEQLNNLLERTHCSLAPVIGAVMYLISSLE